jgi:hypothetical protein
MYASHDFQFACFLFSWRGKPVKHEFFSIETKAFNHSVSRQKYRVERSFGGLKKHFGWSRSIYMGLQKTADYLFM